MKNKSLQSSTYYCIITVFFYAKFFQNYERDQQRSKSRPGVILIFLFRFILKSGITSVKREICVYFSIEEINKMHGTKHKKMDSRQMEKDKNDKFRQKYIIFKNYVYFKRKNILKNLKRNEYRNYFFQI